MYTSPDPLQASVKNAILTLAVSNPGAQVVTVTRLVVTLPVGTNAKNLTADATGVQIGVPDGWQASNAAGSITLTPSGAAGEVSTAGLAFTFAAIAVNAQVGLCTVTIHETASSPSGSAGERTASIGLPKFPAQFQVSDLQANPLDVPSGGSTTLMWAGTGTQATYTLQYQPADEGQPVSVAVGSTGSYRASNLTRTGQVTFTLLVQVPVPGLDQPLTVQRQVTVAVATLSLAVQAEPPSVGMNGLARLGWRTSNAASCVLSVTPAVAGAGAGGAVDLSGSLYFVLAQTTSFTLTATDASGNELEEQRTVIVDPSIVANTAGHVVTGTPGTPGAGGSTGPGPDIPPYGSYGVGGPGGHGGRGGDGVLDATLPPVGPGGTWVVPITVTGGAGGKGGDGGPPDPSLPQNEAFGLGGQGGNGGNAVIDVCFSLGAADPAQYIVTVAGGAAGMGGRSGPTGSETALPGTPGTVGPVHFRDCPPAPSRKGTL
ncbi:MAG TPA: hypothetical protein VE871_08005 [Longimicrobium sp.]|nr:hypothetical protein [Longimicrobium sp.]